MRKRSKCWRTSGGSASSCIVPKICSDEQLFSANPRTAYAGFWCTTDRGAPARRCLWELGRDQESRGDDGAGAARHQAIAGKRVLV